MTEKPNQWAADQYPGDPLAHLRWWCDTSERAAAQLAEVLAERDRVSGIAVEWEFNGTQAHNWLDEFKPRPGADDGPYALLLLVESCVKEVTRLRAELAEQKRLNLALAERLAACSQVLGKAAERGKVCECVAATTAGETP